MGMGILKAQPSHDYGESLYAFIMSSNAFSGVVHNDPQGVLVHLPLEEVRVNALIVDVSARVVVHQIFSNLSENSTSRAKYVFPVPARAAVCAFEMRLGDGRVLIGVCKEQQQAAADHEHAMQQGKMTSLLEWVTDDVFTISIGSIPGGESVTIVLTYVMDLMDDEGAQHVRLQIPVYVGHRYGKIPSGMENTLEPSTQTRVRINANIQMKGAVRLEDVTSPSHNGVSVMPYQTHLGRPSRHRVSAKFRSRRYLNQDFVLRIQAAGLNLPRCFVERDSRGTVAMQLTLMPQFDIPPVAAQEYLFLVDRSGSMQGPRIETAKRSLVMLLRTLPSDGTIFNIFSFGNRCDSLWGKSEVYMQNSLDAATNYVDGMSANYGGTEIGFALRTAFQKRMSTLPTAVFVLTDGEAYDTDGCIAIVKNAVSASAANAPLRVFTLGIGDTTSTDMCEGIAAAGNGVCLMTTSSEGIIAKCAKLFGAGRAFVLKNVDIDWGISPSLQASNGSPSVRFTAHDQVIRQAPSHIDSIYPGFRTVVFALINSDKFVPPQEITLHVQRDGAGAVLSFPIPVEQVKVQDRDRPHRLIHTLAAKRLITELDDQGRVHAISEDERKSSIIRLGEQYQLASRYTSFVAEEGLDSTMIPRRSRRQTSRSEDDQPWTAGEYLQWAIDFAAVAIPTFVQTWFGSPPSDIQPESEDRVGNSVRRPTSMVGLTGSRYDSDDDERGSASSDESFTTLSSLEDHSMSDWSETDTRPPTPLEDPEYVRSSSPTLGIVQGQEASVPQHETEHPPPVDASILHLVRLQLFDGAFRPDGELASIVGEHALNASDDLAVDKQLWSTVLAIAYIQKHVIGQPELVDGLVEKALNYAYRLQESLPERISIPFLLDRAKKLL